MTVVMISIGIANASVEAFSPPLNAPNVRARASSSPPSHGATAALLASRALSVSTHPATWQMTYPRLQTPCEMAVDATSRVDDALCPIHCHDSNTQTLCRATQVNGYSSLPSPLLESLQSIYPTTSDPYLLRGCFANSDLANLQDGGLLLYSVGLTLAGGAPEHIFLESFCETSETCSDVNDDVFAVGGQDDITLAGVTGERAQCISFVAHDAFTLSEVSFRVGKTSFNLTPRAPPTAAPSSPQNSGDGSAWIDAVFEQNLALVIPVATVTCILLLLGCIVVLQRLSPNAARRFLDALSFFTAVLTNTWQSEGTNARDVPAAEDPTAVNSGAAPDAARARPMHTVMHDDSVARETVASFRHAAIVAAFKPVKVERSAAKDPTAVNSGAAPDEARARPMHTVMHDDSVARETAVSFRHAAIGTALKPVKVERLSNSRNFPALASTGRTARSHPVTVPGIVGAT